MHNWKAAAKKYYKQRNSRRQAIDFFLDVMSTRKKLITKMDDNLTSTQARCTELLLEVRRYKAAFEYLRGREKDYPILSVLLKDALSEKDG